VKGELYQLQGSRQAAILTCFRRRPRTKKHIHMLLQEHPNGA
jgi:hypothetical protein